MRFAKLLYKVIMLISSNYDAASRIREINPLYNFYLSECSILEITLLRSTMTNGVCLLKLVVKGCRAKSEM